LQCYDLLEKENTVSCDSEEEDVLDVNKNMTELQQLPIHMHESAFATFGVVPIHTEYMVLYQLFSCMLFFMALSICCQDNS